MPIFLKVQKIIGILNSNKLLEYKNKNLKTQEEIEETQASVQETDDRAIPQPHRSTESLAVEKGNQISK